MYSSRVRNRHDAAFSATDGVADALGRCTRIACAAVLVLVLMGDNTSAGVRVCAKIFWDQGGGRAKYESGLSSAFHDSVHPLVRRSKN